MSDFNIVTSCAPTLAGMKTGSIFTEPCGNRKELAREIREMNRILEPKGIRLVIVRYSEERALIYMYRPQQLRRDLMDPKSREILRHFGYRKMDEEYCVNKLRQQFLTQKEFPHEIGLFLGYPPEDVHGYIVNNGTGSKYVGYWKVYGNVAGAKEIFARYKACTKSYYSQWTHGIPVRDLAVAV